MSRLIVSMMSVVLCAGFALAQGAPAKAEKPAAKPAAEKKAAKPKVVTFSGEIVAVDTVANKLSVKDKKGVTKDFAIVPEVKLLKDGKAIALADFKAGEMVSVKLEGDAPKSVSIHAAKAKKAEKKEKAKEAPKAGK